jgi:hypothetical protein
MVAKPIAPPLVTLVAVTVTVSALEIVAGAVYKPLTMLPTAGETVQFTPEEPAPDALN